MVFQHPAHVQLLDGDGVKPSRKIGHELVQGILPDVGNTGMELGQSDSGLLGISRYGQPQAFGNRCVVRKAQRLPGRLMFAQETARQSPQSLEQGPVRLGTDYLFSLWRMLPWPIPPNPPRSRLGFQRDAGG
ncbi:hypothetical protein A7Q09_08700 [Methylacidiphilum sp. Yel]|nr:hypothetical protein A7Q09_08700 [Methylacidiphilum sp. Yel]